MKKKVENDEFLKRRKMRQRKIRKRRILIGTVVFLIFALVVTAILSVTVLFPIKTITAKEGKRYTSSQIIDASGIKIEDNFFTSNINLDELRLKLPFIENFKIERKFPDTIKITVTEANEYAVVNCDGAYYSISRSWYVLEKYSEKPEELFEIKADKLKCSLGKKIEFSDEKIKTLTESIVDLSDKNNIKLNGVDVTDNLTISITVENRFEVNFGTSNSLENKFAHLGSMIKGIPSDEGGKINLSMWTANDPEGTFVSNKKG